MHKDVSGEQWQLHAMAPVVPSMDGLIDRQEALYFSLPKMLRNALLVPSRCVGRVPERLQCDVFVRDSKKSGITSDGCAHSQQM